MKNRTLTLLLLLNLAALPKLFSQNVSINSTGNMPDTSAMLDVSSTTKGFLAPRMTTVERDAITLPATGLTIFNSTVVAYQVNTGTPAIPVWSTLNSGAGSVSSVSVITANGFDGTVATPTTTPAITLTTTVSGMVKGNGTALLSATPGVNYSLGTAGNPTGIVKSATGTGALTTAIASDFPTLNQNTTGNAATVTTNANLTGPVTSVGNATSITDGVVTNAKLANMPANTIKGNNTGSSGVPLDLTGTQATAMLNLFSPTLQGLVPLSGGGITNFLRADGTWQPLSATDWGLTGNSATNSGTNFLGTTDNVSLIFKSNGIQRMIADSLGSVGIGTSPTFTSGTYREKFLVDAGTTTSYNPMVVQGSIDSFFQFNIQNLSIGAHASSDVVATSNNGTQTSNYVDMGINGSNNTSNIFGKSNDAYLYNQGENFFIATSTPAKSLIFMTGGTDSATYERMRINGSGNIGIGNPAPVEKLDVTGNVKFSGALMPNNLPGTAGSFLTSNGAGTSPTWSTGISGTNSGDVTLGTANGLSLAVQVLSLGLSGTATTGALSSTDWNTFNNKLTTIDTTNISNFSTKVRSLFSATAPITYSNGLIGITQATTSTNGYLSSADWNTFNNKQPQLNGTGFVKASGTTISYDNSTYLTGNQSITLSGDISGTGTTAIITTLPIVNSNVGTWNNLTVNGKGLVTAGSNAGYLTGNQTISFSPTGDVTGSTTGTTTIAPALVIGTNKVLNSMLAQMPALTIKGNNTGGTANAADLTVAEVNAILPVFTSALNGLVPLSGGSAGKVLHADGTWKDTTASTNQWSITGNTGTTSVTNFIGTTDNKSFKIKTNNTQGFLLDSLGNVGIGTAPTPDVTNPEKFLVNAGTTTSVNAIVGKGSINSYLQLNIQNQSAGTGASSDVVATANNGNETSNYVDMGINGGSNTSGVMGVMNDAYLYNLGQNLFVGTGTAAKSLIFMTGGTDSATNERMRITGNGNVGIGIAAPATALHVVKSNPGSNVLTLENSSASGYSSADFLNNSGSLSGTFGYANAGASALFAGRDYFNSYGNDFLWTANSTTAAMFVKGSNSNVGIGTTAPVTALHVLGTNPLTLTGVQLGTTTTADSFLTINSGTVQKLPVSTFATPSNSWSITGNTGTTSTTNFIGTTDNKSFKIKTNSVQGFILDSLGNVGIGASPTFTSGTYREKFLVDAGTTTSYNPMVVQGSIDSFFQFNIQNLSSGTHASSDVVATSNNGTETSYYVDMGINSSANSSNIFGNKNDAYLYNSGENFFIANSTPAKSLIFMTGGTDSATNERMRIDGSGNIGIANPAPSQKLDVTGNVKFSGALMPNNTAGTAGFVLTSSGAGTAPTWVSGQTIVTLGSDVVNNNVTANTIADVTGLSFPVTSGVTYRFSALIIYTSAATTTGSRWSINGPAAPTLLAYASHYSLGVITETDNNAVAYDVPAAANNNSATTTGNICTIEGVITPSANGTVIVRFASEITSSAITAKAGSTLTWW